MNRVNTRSALQVDRESRDQVRAQSLQGVLHVHFSLSPGPEKSSNPPVLETDAHVQANARVHTMGMEEFPDHGTVVLCMLRTTGWGVSQAACHKI
jgi:hypothetical protein